MSRQQGPERGNGGSSCSGIRTGHDHFIAPEASNESFAAGIRAKRLSNGLGQRDLPLR